MYREVYILGYSGHSYTIIEILSKQSIKVAGYYDFQKAVFNPYGLRYMGIESEIDHISSPNEYFVLAVGDNSIRRRIHNILVKNKWQELTVISESASISNSATIGLSTVILPGAIVNAYTKVGQACIINTGSIVEHESTIGDYAHIGPGAVVSGNVSIGEGVFVGANATIKNNISIGDNSIIGAGAVVLKDVPSNQTWAGVPARKIR